MRFFAASLLLLSSCNYAATPPLGPVATCEDHRKHGRREQATACYNKLVNANDAALIAEARSHGAATFGSCSFDEPCVDLTAMGLLDAGA